MGESEVTIAAPDSDSAVAGILGPALDEIRWRHPDVRVSCGALVGPTVRVLICSHPSTRRSLEMRQAVGQDAADFVKHLAAAPEFIVLDMANDPQFAASSDTLMDDEAHAAAIVPLRIDGSIVGFLQADIPHAGPVEQTVVEQLHETAALAAATIQLERERNRSSEYLSQILHVRTSMSRRAARQRKAEQKLHQTIALLHEMVEKVAPKVEQAERAELGSLIHRCAEQVDTAIECLSQPKKTRTPVEGQRHAAS